MNLTLLGYGKMGKAIEKIALKRNHTISLIIDIINPGDLTKEKLEKTDVAIDFSIPSSAYSNIMKCFDANLPVVCGTTGWIDKLDEVKQYCVKNKKTLFYASNYSIGMNIFFRLNKFLAEMMNQFPEYQVRMEEKHHIHKLDAPSGTAITLAETMINSIDRIDKWELNQKKSDSSLEIKAFRENEIPGIHTIIYDSNVDFIEMTHSAKSREGLALGAVLAAEYIYKKKGFFTMDDLMK